MVNKYAIITNETEIIHFEMPNKQIQGQMLCGIHYVNGVLTNKLVNCKKCLEIANNFIKQIYIDNEKV